MWQAWRQLAGGERDQSLEQAFERLQQRLQWMDGPSGTALTVAMANFKRACPERHGDLCVLPSLVRQRRRARQMCQAIEAVSSQDVLLFLQVRLLRHRILWALRGDPGLHPDVVRAALRVLSAGLLEDLKKSRSKDARIGSLGDPDWSLEAFPEPKS